jgi:hypothetical protein
VIIDWKFNAWGGKYPGLCVNDFIPEKIAHLVDVVSISEDTILEGGALDVNGCGEALVTEECVLNPNRNLHMRREDIEKKLHDRLGIVKTHWLKGGLEGDDTDGHIDNVARFINETTIVYAQEKNQEAMNFKMLSDNEERLKKIKNLKEPIITKPRFGGSSIGVEIIKSKKDIEKIEEKTDIIAQKFIQGRELTCPVLEIKGKVIALPVIEIRPNKQFEFFDYQAKYTSGASEEIVPAPIPSTLKKKIQEMAIRAHNSLGCAVYSRTDFIVKNKQVVILEINTLPGLTKNSLLPKSAAAQGISFSELLDIIIESSLRKYQ